MACKLKRGLYALVGLLGLAFAVHYALFGSLPIGIPQLLKDGEEDDIEWQEVEP
jgi:hypothetical protein